MDTAPQILPGFEPLAFPARGDGPAPPAATLLLHGIAARPRQLESLGRALADAGLHTVVPLLAGHGTRSADMHGLSWQDFYSGVEAEYLALKERYDHVTVVGFSLGASLALELAANHPVDAQVLICTPLKTFLPFIPKAPALRLLEKATRYVPTFSKRLRPGETRGVYRRIPVSSLREVFELNRRVRWRLPQVKAPTLIVHATRDFTSRRKSGLILARELGSAEKKIVWVATRNHEVTLFEKSEFVIQSVVDFVTASAGAPKQTA